MRTVEFATTAPGSMSRPIIGLCAAVERARWSVWDDEAVLLPRGYVDAVQRAGGLARPAPARRADPEEVLALLDGADPRRAAPTTARRPERDAFEIALGLAAMERDVPLLGVCRGMQLMNLARGGTLIEHLPDVVGHEDHRARARAPSATTTCGWPTARSPPAPPGATSHPTKSHHHQGVDRDRGGLRGDRLGDRGRAAGGDRGPDAPVRARRAVAPGGRSGGEEIAALVEAARA